MIIKNNIEIKTTNKNIEYYTRLGYNIKSGDIITINVHELPKTSKQKIEVSCDNCDEKYTISYFSYLRNIKEDKVYHCKKCSGIRSKETNLNKYGVIHPSQLDEFKEKTQNTNLKKYGVKYSMQNTEIKNKFKATIKQKSSNIIFEKYGVYSPAQNSDVYQKMMKNGLHIYKFKDTDIYYQGEYELDFLNKYFEIIEIKRGSSIKYIFNNKEFIYFPDFYNEKLNLIIEIKSSYWYDKHKDKNIAKQLACKEQGYNFIFIIDKNYDIFSKIVESITYTKEHCWQYDIRLNTLKDDIIKIDFDYKNLKISDFNFEFIDKDDSRTKDIVTFIKKYEWLGKMPNRPTHRFIATYKGMMAGAIVMSTPNAFSNILGDNTSDIEKLISRGACASWTPKNLASALIMWSIKWMVKNTEFRLFEAYADTEAKELGTIYQACNFYYLGNNFGSTKLYFDPENIDKGWVNSRGFRKLNFYKSYLKSINITWQDDWNKKTKILWENISDKISELMKTHSIESINKCHMRTINHKHKYIYILGENNRETKKLRNKFKSTNMNYNYPKNR